jgi:predicted RNA binding protein YcfA (HicA-like mRNA interferase family)
MKLPVLSAKELITILQKMGFQEVRQRGSHKYFKHADGRAVVVPVHPGRDLGRGLLRKIIKEIEMSREEFLKHCQKV